MAIKSKILGLSSVQSGLLKPLNGIVKGELEKRFKIKMRTDAEDIKKAIKDLAESCPSEWDDARFLSDKAIRLRAWRGIDENTPWIESGWVLDCLIVDENWDKVDVDADFTLSVHFAEGLSGSHGVDIDWLVWTLEYGGYGKDGQVIPARPLIGLIEKEIIQSGTLEKSYWKMFKDYFNS